MRLRPFEIILVTVFVGIGVLSLLVLSTVSTPDNDDGPVIGSVTIWGILDRGSMSELLDELVRQNESYANVSYRQVDKRSFSEELTNALADGRGPDVILFSSEQLVDLRRRIAPISYTSFPLRDVRSLYLDGASIFALEDGLYAYPIAVDPLMMYWNTDLLATENLLQPPETWEILVNTYASRLTVRDFDRTVRQSIVALGEYGNIRNAFGTISMLLLQSGSRMVEENAGRYEIRLNDAISGGRPLVTTTDFYTRFSRPSNTLYSWNRGLNEDRERFLAEDLALYFGKASEGVDIEQLNPNLRFDIAEVPQGAAATVRRTYGEFYGLALVRNSDNPSGAAAVMSVLAGQDIAARIAESNDMVPVTRVMVSAGSNDIYGRLAYRSAAIAYGWLNPERAAADDIFTELMRDVTEGRFNETQATVDALDRFELVYN